MRSDWVKTVSAATLALLSVGVQFKAQTASSMRQVELEVHINGIRNEAGKLGCQVFNAAKGFPNDSDKAIAGFYVSISSGVALCKFSGLVAGQYAVAVLHDENNNQLLDTHMLGIPKEGYGVSNNKTYAMSQPKWDESRFDIVAGEKKSITISLRY
jgi:uncharacterized protein (DUF2141 family)